MKPLLPHVRNVSPRLLAEDIFPYIPDDEENQKAWDKIFKDFRIKMRKDFEEKGIPIPRIDIDYTKEKIKLPYHE